MTMHEITLSPDPVSKVEKFTVFGDVTGCVRNTVGGIFALSPKFVANHSIITDHVLPASSIFGGSIAVLLGTYQTANFAHKAYEAWKGGDQAAFHQYVILTFFFTTLTVLGSMMIVGGSGICPLHSLAIPIAGFILYGSVALFALHSMKNALQFRSQLDSLSFEDLHKLAIDKPAYVERMTNTECLKMLQKYENEITPSEIQSQDAALFREKILAECKLANKKRMLNYQITMMIAIIGLMGFTLLGHGVDPSFIFALTGFLWTFTDSSAVKFHLANAVYGEGHVYTFKDIVV